MNFSQIRYARLDREKMAKIRDLEEKLGGWLVAVEPIAKLADLSEADVQTIKTAEEELGIILLAYQSESA
jgi:hypothetical protein